MGLLQNLLIRIKGDPSNAVQAFSRTEQAGKKMGRTLREEVTNPLKGAFEHVVGNAKSFVLSLIAVEKTLETIKRLFERGRSTRDIANRFRISNQQAALINRTANITGESADEIATKLGFEERKLSEKEVAAVVQAIAQQQPFSVAAERQLADKTFTADVAGRRALEASSQGVLASDSVIAPTSRFNPTVTNLSVPRPTNIPATIRKDSNALIQKGESQQLLRELQQIKKNTAEQVRATKQEISI